MERFAERSIAAGAVAGVLAAPFAGPRRGFAVGFSSVPKAPGAGREGFATSLGRFLALRGVLAMDRSCLRRLGQVDTVLLDEAALRGDRYEPIDLELLGGADPERTAERLFDLFDPDEPLETRHDSGWVLGPLDRLELTGRTGQQTAARLRRRGSERVLGLARGRTLQAVVGLAPQTVPGAEAVAAAARRAGSRIVLATDRQQPTDITFADAVVPSGGRLVASVRSLQADGAVVLLLSGNRRALGAADCGIGVHREGEPPPGAPICSSAPTWSRPGSSWTPSAWPHGSTGRAPCCPPAAAPSARWPPSRRCRTRPPRAPRRPAPARGPWPSPWATGGRASSSPAPWTRR
ncbi:hypothetical protein ACFQ2Y_42185 [Streptomyces malaysiensis subsp. malaysiensis]